jgi:rhodanese-related sulfurtransferase
MKKIITILLVVTISTVSCSSQQQQSVNLTVAAFAKGLNNPNIQVLDVRSASEYSSGHIKGALQANWNNTQEFEERCKSLDKSKPVYAYCLSGFRSADAAEWLRSQGFQAYNLQGGVNAWRQQKMSLEGASNVPAISIEQFTGMLATNGYTLVDVGATWCPPCKKMNPIIDSLAKANEQRFMLLKIDGGEQPNLSSALRANAYPTFIIYKNKQEIWRKEGLVTPQELLAQMP